MDGDECSASHLSHFTPATHWIGGCVGCRGDLVSVKKEISYLCRESNPDSEHVQAAALQEVRESLTNSVNEGAPYGPV
jgi:hypothetical protein